MKMQPWYLANLERLSALYLADETTKLMFMDYCVQIFEKVVLNFK
jgi:hypothetical protein